MSETPIITVSRRSTIEERQIALYHIYQQVLERQPYAYEHKLLAKVEKDFLNDKIGVKRFLLELGQSEVYLQSFYHSSSNMKFLELCFKHFMGRAPSDPEELRDYCNLLMHQGVGKMIEAILNSEEYRKAYGCFTVPYPRQPKQYVSPKAYLESTILNHEHIAQRGRIVPTIYWHQLGLACEGGACDHPEAKEGLEPGISQQELLDLLKALKSPGGDRVLASLSSQQKEMLRRAILQN